MRLLTICHMFPCQLMPKYGVFLIRQSQYVAEHDIQFTFLVPRPYSPWPLYKLPRFREYGPANPLLIQPSQNVQSVRYLRLPGGWFRRFEGRAIHFASRHIAARLHEQNKFDAILTTPLLPDSTAAFRISRELGLPLAMLSIGSDVMVYPNGNKHLQNELRASLPQAELTVGVSDAICEKMRDYGATNPLCVYLGRDQKLFAPPENRDTIRAELGWEPDKVYGVLVGRLTPEKGTNELCQALRQLFQRYPTFRFVFVGEGAARPQIQAFADRPENIGRIQITGEIPPETIPQFLQAADFFALPSYSEGMPQAVLEAMNCGLPIIATRVGGIPEAVLDGTNGIVIAPKNVVELETAMRRLITDKTLREEMGQQSIKIANNKFDSKKNAAKLATALRRLQANQTTGQLLAK